MNTTRGVYAVYDRATLDDDALTRVDAVLAAGVRWLQYRDKRAAAPDRALVAALRVRARAHGAKLIINDDWRLAAETGADGVHLGQNDPAVAEARRALGAAALIGASCHDDIARARAALADGADHVSFGRFFASTTKPEAPGARLAVLGQARALGAPVVAIGGIDADNAAQVIAAGADRIAVAGGLFRVADSGAAARRLVGLFTARASSA